MKTLKLTSIAFAICFLLLGVQKSDAIKITEFPSDTEDTSYNGYTYHMAYVRTDKPIYHVSWYIDNTHVYGETLDSTTNYASFYPYDKIPGRIQGKKYEIGVKVWEWDADAEVFRSATDSYTVRMFEPLYLYHAGENTGAWGYAEISKFYYDGSYVVMNSYAYASNPSNNPKAKDPEDNPMQVVAWFRTNQFTGLNGDEIHPERRDTQSPETVKVGQTSQYFSPDGIADDGDEFDRWVGTKTDRDEPLYFLAHTHLHVYPLKGGKPDDWEVDTGVLEFDWTD